MSLIAEFFIFSIVANDNVHAKRQCRAYLAALFLEKRKASNNLFKPECEKKLKS